MSEIKIGQLRRDFSGGLYVVLERVSDEHWSVMFNEGNVVAKWFYPWIQQAELVSEPEGAT